MRACVAALLSLGLLAASALPVPAQQAPSPGSCTFNVQGSDTMVILGQRWASQYMAEFPAANISVTGGGSGTGLAALLNDTCHIAQSSRPMKPKERVDFARSFRARPLELAVALDGLAVFVHRDNPLTSLTVEQVRAIYVGRITNFREVGGPDQPITVYGRESNSGTYVTFKEMVLDNGDFAASTNFLAGTAAVINAVSADRSAIGYGGIAYGEGIKVLALAPDADSPALLPTEENVESGAYTLTRPLFFYLNPHRLTPCMADFIRWVLSDEGQDAVGAVGYFPVSGEVREKDLGLLGEALAAGGGAAGGGAAE